MKILLYICLGLFLCAGCRSYSYIDNYQITPNSSRLPKLSVITDQEIFNPTQDAYADSYSRSIGTASNLHLVERQFTKYILDHLTTTRTKKYGYAVMRINHMKVRNNYSLLSIASIISVGLSTVIGIPAGQYVVELDISMEILDENQKMLGIYNGKGKHKALIAMYYGYSEKDAKEKCLYEALEQCLNAINEKVMRDFDYLESSLLKK